MQTSKVLERDTQHQELAKLRLSQDQLNTTLQEQREEIQRLTQHINTTEQQLNRVSSVVLEAGQVPNRGSVVDVEVPSLLPPAAPLPSTHTHTHTTH